MRADMSQEFPKKELETLWAPWRVEYFEKEPPDLNFLSEAARTSDDAAHLVITRRKNAFLMMNRYPYAVGHLMAVPYRKTGEFSALGENEIVELWNLVAHAQALLRATTKAQGFNIGFNAVIRQFVKGQTLLIQPAETHFVPKEWTILNVSDAFEQVLDRALQPDQDCTCLA